MTEAARSKDMEKYTVVPLPATAGDLERKSLRSRTINDYAEDVFLRLYGKHEEFTKFLDAVGNDEAVEGSVLADDFTAARILRDEADTGSPLKDKKLETIRKALNVVLRRYGISRKERRVLLGGEIVSNDDE